MNEKLDERAQKIIENLAIKLAQVNVNLAILEEEFAEYVKKTEKNQEK